MLAIIYTKYSVLEYILEGIQKKDVILIEAERSNLTIVQRIIRKLLSSLYISNRFTSLYYKKSFQQKIVGLCDCDKILVLGHSRMNELKVLNNLIPNKIEKYLWYWNPLNTEYKNCSAHRIKGIIKDVKLLGYSIATFDEQDAIHYKIDLRNQFYRYPPMNSTTSDTICDFYFIGYPKDREDKIIEIENRLQNMGYHTNIKVIRKVSEELSYFQNLDNIHKSKCIIDINQNGQTGLTLRPLEAVFLHKKLITNNLNIINADFYDPNNIFVLGKDNIELLSQFMNKNITKVPSHILNKYEINNWINYYLE